MARTDTLVQTLLSPELAAWVRCRAAMDGLQVSGWIRQLIHRERLKLVVEAWWFPPKSTPPKKLVDPLFKLERLGVIATGMEFTLLNVDGEAVTHLDLEKKHAAMKAEFYSGNFILRGDTRLWTVLHAFADADNTNGMRLTMEPKAAARRSR